MTASVPDKLVCTVYRASRETELYIYLKRDEGLQKIPAELASRLGALSEVLTLVLTPERKLARVKAADVMAAITDKGYYLQLPPDFNPVRFTLGG